MIDEEHERDAYRPVDLRSLPSLPDPETEKDKAREKLRELREALRVD